MKINLQVLCLAIAVGAFFLPAAPASAQSAPNGDVDKGSKAFNAVGCFQCHGYVGQGGGAAGPEVAKTKLPFDAFLMQLRKPSNQMPPYEAVVLSDSTVADIYAYIQSLPGPVDMDKVTLPH